MDHNRFLVERIAKVAHEVNRAYCECLGDWTIPNWEEAPNWQRNSARAGVEFHLANPDASPSASHEAWLNTKLAEGWRYGEEKDAEAKTHPCMVPFDALPLTQQAKDFLFRAVVHALRVQA